MAHNNTILSQLLKLVSRHEFESLAKILTSHTLTTYLLLKH